jgi:ketosteroid isomerase-like protein
VACATGSYTKVQLVPTARFVVGQRYGVVVPAAAVRDAAGNPSVAATGAFRAPTVVEDASAAVVGTWPVAKSASALGGSYLRDHLANAFATWRFTGTSVTWWTMTGKAQGKAQVLVDGVRRLTVNNYSATTHWRVARTVKRLRAGTHTITVRVLGQKGAKAATGTYVTVDRFTAGKASTQTPLSALRTAFGKSYTSGRAVAADLRGEAVTLTFRGTSVTWTTMRSATQGKAAVYVDGKLKATVDNYAAKTSYGVRRAIAKLSDSVHVLKIVVLGTHHKGGKGNLVTVDRIAVS